MTEASVIDAGARVRLSSHTAITALVLVAAGINSLLGALAPPPNLGDELTYIELARSLGRTGAFDVLGVSFPPLTYSPAYVALLAPIYRFAASPADALLLVRVLNSCLFATAAVPAFLIARRCVSRRAALLVAAATVALPAAAYAGKVMTESLAFPLVLCCVLATLRVAEAPSRRRQLVLGLALVAAVAARFEFLVLFPALAAAALAAAPRARSRLLPFVAGSIVAVVAALAAVHATSHAGAGSGAHGVAAGRFSIGGFAKILAGSVGAEALLAGLIPAIVFGIALVEVRRRADWISPSVRRLVLTTACLGFALLLTGSVYLATVPFAYRPPNPQDRYTFYVTPLLLIVFAAYVESGRYRRHGTRAVVLAATALPTVAALAYFHADQRMTYSGLAVLPFVVLASNHAVFVGLVAIFSLWCAACVLRPGSEPSRLVATVAAALAATTISTYCLFVAAPTHSPAPGWLDALANGRTVAVWVRQPPALASQALIEVASANESLAAVYSVAEPSGRGIPAAERRVESAEDGTVLDHGRPVRAKYVLTASGTRFVGTLVAKRDGLALFRVPSVVRVPGRPIAVSPR